MKKVAINILRFMKRKKLKNSQSIIMDSSVLFGFTSLFDGKNKINKNTIIENSKIGLATYIGQECSFYNTVVGKYCSIANNVKTVIATHPVNTFVSTHPAFFSTLKQAGFTYTNKQLFDEIKYIDKENKVSVIIGNDVWIGENVIILGGVTIGDGAVIGAGAVVTHDIEPYSINVGVPSKKIRYRFEKNEIEFLENLKWWDKPEEWIKNNIDKFENINKMKELI